MSIPLVEFGKRMRGASCDRPAVELLTDGSDCEKCRGRDSRVRRDASRFWLTENSLGNSAKLDSTTDLF